jgi:long-chain acyl-CoA synthetase
LNVADVLTRHARARPEAPAVVEAGRELSYQAFDGAVWRAGAALRRQGIEPGQVVGLSLPRSALHLVVLYALARIGAIQLPLPLREPPLLREGVARRFGAVCQVLANDSAKLPALSHIRADPAWLEADGAADESLRTAGGGDSWRIVLSSGTVAAPKAVLQSHDANVAWREICARMAPVAPEDRFLSHVDFDFYAGVRQCMEVHWDGAAVLLEERPASGRELVEAVERHRVSLLHLNAVHLHPILADLPPGDRLLPGVRRLRSGAMVSSEAMRAAVRRRLTPNLMVGYGANEVGSLLTAANAEVLDRHPGSVGIPAQGVRLEIVDELGAPLPSGSTGQIRVQTPCMPERYIDNRAASAQAFRDGWYYPGDLGMLSAEGALYFKGRADDQINFDGIKLYPADIEAVLLEHPAVREAAAFPIDSPQHQQVPAAAVVLREKIATDVLTQWCIERLGSHAPMVVAAVREMPRNAAGKILKRELAAQVAGHVKAQMARR